MRKDNFDLLGVFLILIAIILFVCYSVFGDIEGLLLGIIFGTVGIALVNFSQKINYEGTILSGLLLLFSAGVSMVNIPEIIAVAVIVISGTGILLVILKPPENERPTPNSTVEQ
ncbi:MAG: hypothetical protein WC428_07080 [Candidatus Paceibacterota bacterium]